MNRIIKKQMERGQVKKKDITAYEIEAQIGRGASGTCYRAICKSDGQVCAIKKIAINTMKSNSLKLAMKEVTVLKSIDHPHIIKYFDSFVDEHYLYIVMQYAAKGDLHTILKKRKLKQQYFNEQQLWKMAKMILDALKYLHANNIVHRDVKTLNIFMGEDGSLLLGDLGVSKILKNDLGLYSRVGTPLYLAPQIIKYEKYDYKADIWGLGCVMYILATLNHPFQGKNIVTLGQNILQTQPKPIKNYTPQLQAFIFKMLEKNPTKRPDANFLLKNNKIQIAINCQTSSPQKKSPQKKRIVSQTAKEKIVQKQISPIRKPTQFSSQRKIESSNSDIHGTEMNLQKNTSHFKVVLPIKDFNNFIKINDNKKHSLGKSRNISAQQIQEIKRKESGEDTIILKPNKNRFYQYCFPTQKTQLRSNHKESYLGGKKNEKESWEDFGQFEEKAKSKREINPVNIDGLFSDQLKVNKQIAESKKIFKEEKQSRQDALFHELVKNKVRTQENKKDSLTNQQAYSTNIVRKRDIKSAYPGRSMGQKDFSASSQNISKEAVCVNVNKMFFNEEAKDKKPNMRPQSSMGRKFIGQREIKYIRKKVGNQLNLDNNNTRTQLLKKPQMIIL